MFLTLQHCGFVRGAKQTKQTKEGSTLPPFTMARSLAQVQWVNQPKQPCTNPILESCGPSLILAPGRQGRSSGPRAQLACSPALDRRGTQLLDVL